MRVAILHNAVPDDAPLEDQDTLVQVESIEAALRRLEHQTFSLPCTLDLAALVTQLRENRPDVIFNLVESLGGADSLTYLPLAVLDTLNIPYTGSGTEATFITTHKVLAKQRLHAAGLPTPTWMESVEQSSESFVATSRSPSCSWIIKGVWEQASRGMDDDAVLKDVASADVQRRLKERAARTGRPCFAEQFIEGREFNVAVLAGQNGPEVLPPAEIDFSAFPPNKPRIVGHRAKWQTDSFEYHHTPRRFEFESCDAPLLERLRKLAEESWELFGLRGWVRVDFRVDRSGQPWILEINTNPCLSPDAGFAAALENAGISFDEAVERILADVNTGK